MVNSGGTVTPIGLTARRAGKPIKVGANPQAIAITPDGSTAFVANYSSNSVTAIGVATGHPGPAVPAGQAPNSLAVTPNSTKVVVVGGDSDAVTPITAATGRPAAASRWGTRRPRSPCPRRAGRRTW